MIGVLSLTTFLLSANSSFALDPQSEAQSLHDQTHGEITFEHGKEEEVPNYTDSPDELKYYSNSSAIESDAFVESNTNDAGIATQDSYYNRPDISVSGSESFFDQSKQTISDAAVMADFVTGEYKDCEIEGDPENNSLLETRSCDSYINLEDKSCELNREITVGGGYEYQCKKGQRTFERNCDKILEVQVTTTQVQEFIDPLNITSHCWIQYNTGGSMGTGWGWGFWFTCDPSTNSQLVSYFNSMSSGQRMKFSGHGSNDGKIFTRGAVHEYGGMGVYYVALGSSSVSGQGWFYSSGGFSVVKEQTTTVTSTQDLWREECNG